MLKTGRPVDQIRFYKDMRTKKADKSYVDVKSRQNADLMDELAQERTDEEGNLTIPTQEIVTDVIGIKRGREPLEGRVPPKMTKVAIEDLRRVHEEAYAEVARVCEETTQEIQTMQSQINSTVRQAFREMMMSMGFTPQQTTSQVSSHSRADDRNGYSGTYNNVDDVGGEDDENEHLDDVFG